MLHESEDMLRRLKSDDPAVRSTAEAELKLERWRRRDESEQGSGRLWLDGHDCVRYEWGSRCSSDCPVSKIVCIAERTDESGPLIDDWFLIFLTRDLRYEASHYAVGVDEFRDEFFRRTGIRIESELARSTDVRSRIIWPPDLRGQELYLYAPWRDHPPQTLCERIRSWCRRLFGVSYIHIRPQVAQRLGLRVGPS